MTEKKKASATPTRAKNWVFTVHGGVEWDIPEKFMDGKKENGRTYLIYQQEIGWDQWKVAGVDGKRHDQGFVEFEKPISLAALKRLPGHKGTHWSKMWSNPTLCSNYCKKDYEVIRQPGVDANKLSLSICDAIAKEYHASHKSDSVVVLRDGEKPLPTDRIISAAVQGTREEEGTLSVKAGKGQGSRSDLKKIQDAVKSGKSLHEIADTYSEFYKYHVGIEKHIELKRQRERNYAQPFPEILWFYGDCGQGKTVISVDLLGGYEQDGDTYYKYEDDKGWWDLYQGEKDLWLNEINEDSFKPLRLLELLDRTGIKVSRRGKPPILCKPTRIIVTSMTDPDSWFKDSFGNETNETKALRRRIKERTFKVEDFQITGPNAEWFNSKYVLPPYKQIFAREDELRAKYEAKVPKVKIEHTGFLFADLDSKVAEATVLDMHAYAMYTDADLRQDGGARADAPGLGLETVYESSDEESDEDDEKE